MFLGPFGLDFASARGAKMGGIAASKVKPSGAFEVVEWSALFQVNSMRLSLLSRSRSGEPDLAGVYSPNRSLSIPGEFHG